MWDDILQPDYGIDTSPPDPTIITQVLLYLDKKDADEFKRLAKKSMMRHWPNTYKEQANLSELILKLLRNDNNPKAKEIPY